MKKSQVPSLLWLTRWVLSNDEVEPQEIFDHMLDVSVNPVHVPWLNEVYAVLPTAKDMSGEFLRVRLRARQAMKSSPYIYVLMYDDGTGDSLQITRHSSGSHLHSDETDASLCLLYSNPADIYKDFGIVFPPCYTYAGYTKKSDFGGYDESGHLLDHHIVTSE